jgi:glycosyltransferase involved in cell wall biosynthesis
MNNKNIMILTHWSYNDALIQNYTLPYVNIIRKILSKNQKIVVITSEQKKIELNIRDIIKINEQWKNDNITLIAQPYHAMGFWKILNLFFDFCKLVALIKINKISTIHCFCTPAGSIGYILSKITGARLIIDSYEPHADSMVENGSWSKISLRYRILNWFEKLQSRHATCFIAATASMKEYAEKKYNMQAKFFYVKPACVNFKKFYLRHKDINLMDELGLNGKTVCVYAGKLGGIYLNSEVFDFIKECYQYWGDNFRFLILTNATHEMVQKEMTRVGLPKKSVIQKEIVYEDVPRYLSTGDFAINPVKPVPTKKYCTSLKDGEYWATGLPIVITKNISDDSEIIRNSGYGYELQTLNVQEYQRAISVIDNLIGGNIIELRQKIRKIAEKYRNFHIAEKIYTEIYSQNKVIVN